jgi:type IV secretory pathway VirB10-like protein
VNEPTVSEGAGVKTRKPAIVAGIFAIAIALGIGLSIVNLVFRSKPASQPTKVMAASEPSKPVPVPPSLPQQAKAEIAQMKREDEHSVNQPNPQAPSGQAPVVDPAVELKRRRDMAISLSPGGWVRGQDIAAVSAKPADDPALDELSRLYSQVEAQKPAQEPSLPAKVNAAKYQFAEPDPDVVKMPDGSTGYVLRKGRILEAALENRLEGEFSGPVRCHTTTTVYTDDGAHLLIPAGAVLLGEAVQVGNQNQHRLAVLFTDLQGPGWSLDLGKATGLDQEGATALRDKINRHTLSTVAAVAAVGVLGGIAQANSGNVLNGSGVDRIESGIGAQAGMIGSQIVQQAMNRPPEISIRPGQRLRIWINQPVVLPEEKLK